MMYRNLGSTGLKVSEIAMGTASLSGRGGGYGFGEIGDDESIELVKYALDKGVNLFDTAPIYGFGLSEKRLGQALKSHREKAIIISKSGITWHSNKRVNQTNDPKIAQKMLEQSLKDLQTEYIDIYMVHWPDKDIDIRYTLEFFKKAQDQGKIKHLGLCNTNMTDLKLSKEVCSIEVVQSEFSLFNQKIKKDLFDYLKENQIGFLSWGTLDKGILTGSVNKKRVFSKEDARSWAPWWKKSNKDQKMEIMEKVLPFLEQKGVSPTHHAIGFNLAHEVLSSCLCGFKSKEQLDSLISIYDDFDKQVLELTKEYFLEFS